MAHFDPSGPATFEGPYGLPHTVDEARLVLLPVEWEPTTSYRRGTARGPRAVLRASRQVELFVPSLRATWTRGRPYEAGIACLPFEPRVQEWNATATRAADVVIASYEDASIDPAHVEAARREVNGLSAELDEWVYRAAKAQLDAGKLVGTLGGDHSSPFGAIRAHAERFPRLGVLHFDAHADLRVAYEGFARSHASILHNVLADLPAVERVVQVGIRDASEEELDAIDASGGRVRAFTGADLASRRFGGEAFAATAREVVSPLPEHVYVTFDIDGLDPSLCPNTGTPVPGGLSFDEAVTILEEVVRSGRKLVGFDLTEVAPGADEWDANVGARVLYRLASLCIASAPSP